MYKHTHTRTQTRMPTYTLTYTDKHTHTHNLKRYVDCMVGKDCMQWDFVAETRKSLPHGIASCVAMMQELCIVAWTTATGDIPVFLILVPLLFLSGYVSKRNVNKDLHGLAELRKMLRILSWKTLCNWYRCQTARLVVV